MNRLNSLVFIVCAIACSMHSNIFGAMEERFAPPRDAIYLDWENFTDDDWTAVRNTEWRILLEDHERKLLKIKLTCLIDSLLRNLEELEIKEEEERAIATQRAKPFLLASAGFLPLSVYFFQSKNNVVAGTIAAIAAIISFFPFAQSKYKASSSSIIKKRLLEFIDDIDKKIVPNEPLKFESVQEFCTKQDAFSFHKAQQFIEQCPFPFLNLLHNLEGFDIQKAQNIMLTHKERSYLSLTGKPSINELKTMSINTINRLVDNNFNDQQLRFLKNNELFYARLCRVNYLVEHTSNDQTIETLIEYIQNYNELLKPDHELNMEKTASIHQILNNLSQNIGEHPRFPPPIKQFFSTEIQQKMLIILENPIFDYLNSPAVKKLLEEYRKLF